MTMDPWGAAGAPSARGWHLKNPTKTGGKQELQTLSFSYSGRTHLNPRCQAVLVGFAEKTDRDMA